MKRIAIVLSFSFLVFSMGILWVQAQSVGAHVEGTVTQEGKPLPNVQLVFTYADNGRTFKTKTDKNGHFALVGAPYGSYDVDVLGEKGEKLFSQKASLGHEDTSNPDELKIDIPKGGAVADNKFGLPDPAAPKLTKEQIAKIAADNKKIAGLNSLITEAQNARQAQDWPKAENALKQLIAAAPDSSRWDFYMALGEAQTKANKLPEAAQTYDKGIKVAQSLISGSTPADPKIPSLNPGAARSGAARMLTSQGNIYLKLQKQDDAIASLKKATEIDPSTALYSYNLCGVEFNAQKFDDAKTACNKYLQLDPSGPHVEEVKTFLSQMPAK